MWTTFTWVIIIMQTCTFFRSSFALRLVVSPAVEQDMYPDDRATGDTGDRFSDGKYLGIHRADKGVFYVWPLDPLLPYRFRKRMSCSWTALAFASAVVNTDPEEPG